MVSAGVGRCRNVIDGAASEWWIVKYFAGWRQMVQNGAGWHQMVQNGAGW